MWKEEQNNGKKETEGIPIAFLGICRHVLYGDEILAEEAAYPIARILVFFVASHYSVPPST